VGNVSRQSLAWDIAPEPGPKKTENKKYHQTSTICTYGERGGGVEGAYPKNVCTVLCQKHLWPGQDGHPVFLPIEALVDGLVL
jgi:hypothetical protein